MSRFLPLSECNYGWLCDVGFGIFGVDDDVEAQGHEIVSHCEEGLCFELWLEGGVARDMYNM